MDETDVMQAKIERLERRAAQVDAALNLARVDLDADTWPDGLAACDVIEKYLVGPAVQYIGELEADVARLRAALVEIDRLASEKYGDDGYCACNSIAEIADDALASGPGATAEDDTVKPA